MTDRGQLERWAKEHDGAILAVAGRYEGLSTTAEDIRQSPHEPPPRDPRIESVLGAIKHLPAQQQRKLRHIVGNGTPDPNDGQGGGGDGRGRMVQQNPRDPGALRVACETLKGGLPRSAGARDRRGAKRVLIDDESRAICRYPPNSFESRSYSRFGRPIPVRTNVFRGFPRTRMRGILCEGRPSLARLN